LLDIAVDICDLFIDDGVIVSVKPRVGRPVTYNDRGIANYSNFPIAVLVNNFSASAAEILSACLQDHGRAVVVGERSYGKGSVQSIERFPTTGGQIKLTTARYFPPSDKNIDKHSSGGKDEDEWGVKPDKGYEVKLSREEKQELADFFRDREIIKAKPDAEKKTIKDKQLDKALEYVRGQMKASADKPLKKAG
jgi:C-terminal peptidase prc